MIRLKLIALDTLGIVLLIYRYMYRYQFKAWFQRIRCKSTSIIPVCDGLITPRKLHIPEVKLFTCKQSTLSNCLIFLLITYAININS